MRARTIKRQAMSTAARRSRSSGRPPVLDRTAQRLSAAVDVGGTFIDVVVADPRSGTTQIAKVLHRHGEQGADILEAIANLAQSFNAGIADVDNIVIGTTVVTNALLQGRLAR